MMARYTQNPWLLEHIGKQVKARRLELGLSHRQLADAVPSGGLDNSTIWRIEHAEHGPSIETLCLLAAALDCEPADLLPSLDEIPGLLLR